MKVNFLVEKNILESFNAVLHIMAITVLPFYNNLQTSFECYFRDKTMDDKLTFIANNKINIANAEDPILLR